MVTGPSVTSRSVRWLPMNPAPPMMNERIRPEMPHNWLVSKSGVPFLHSRGASPDHDEIGLGVPVGASGDRPAPLSRREITKKPLDSRSVPQERSVAVEKSCAPHRGGGPERPAHLALHGIGGNEAPSRRRFHAGAHRPVR